MASSFDAPAVMRRVGESIAGYRVTEIEWDRVWVASGGARCAVGMHFGVRQADSELATALSGERYAKLPWVLPQALVAGLSKRAEMEFSLTSKAIDALFGRGADVFAGLRLKALGPAEQGAGLKLFDIRLDSLLERLGIENGDVLVSLNGESISTARDVERVLDAARDAAEMRVGFERRGEPFVLQLTRLDRDSLAEQ
jgi:general secretion pathway protein C